MFNVWFDTEGPDAEPTLFDRREDAQEYARLYEHSHVEEVAVMDEALAGGFIEEARAEIEAELFDAEADGGR